MQTNRSIIIVLLVILGAFLLGNTSRAFDRHSKADQTLAVQSLIAEQTGIFISVQ